MARNVVGKAELIRKFLKERTQVNKFDDEQYAMYLSKAIDESKFVYNKSWDKLDNSQKDMMIAYVITCEW